MSSNVNYPRQSGMIVDPQTESNPWTLRIVILAVAGFILMIGVMIAALAGYQFMYQDRIYPGVSSVYGVNLTGMTQDEARNALEQRFTYDQDAVFEFTFDGQTWEYTAADLGVNFDVDATVAQAYAIGRGGNMFSNLGNQLSALTSGAPVEPVITYNQTQAENLLGRLARDYINRPVLDATITINNGQPVTTASQVGRNVDVPETLNLLEGEIVNLSERSAFNLVVRETTPTVWDTTSIADEVAIALDERGVTFFVDPSLGLNAGPWTALPSDIENMLRIERIDGTDGSISYDVSLNDEQVLQFLLRVAPDLRIEPVNARFIFNDDTRQLEPIQNSVTGRELDVETTLPKFRAAVFSQDNRSVELVFNDVIPEIPDTATAAELGIVELVQSSTTYYQGSTAARQTNIQVAANRFHGVVIPPNSEFSFNQWLGDVSQDTGYEEALIIVGDQTIAGVGGGVCQVSSTVFQAAFYAGFPILERYPHAFRVGYYEVGEGAGMDATVYEPIVDFRFMNDTPYHLLMETYVVPASSAVTFRFYSTSTGRTVSKDGPYIQNVRPAPPPKYIATPGLSRGQTIQVDYAVAGADVFVYRTVRDAEGNIIINREEFYSGYVPWPAQFQVSVDDPRVN